jgi:hypothetical protein
MHSEGSAKVWVSLPQPIGSTVLRSCDNDAGFVLWFSFYPLVIVQTCYKKSKQSAFTIIPL